MTICALMKSWFWARKEAPQSRSLVASHVSLYFILGRIESTELMEREKSEGAKMKPPNRTRIEVEFSIRKNR